MSAFDRPTDKHANDVARNEVQGCENSQPNGCIVRSDALRVGEPEFMAGGRSERWYQEGEHKADPYRDNQE